MNIVEQLGSKPHNHEEADASNDDLLWLRPDVKVEPLVCGWHAWPHLLAPVQLAMNLRSRHLPALRSFTMNPKVHVAASSNPAMFGGPFVDLPASAIDEAKELIRYIVEDCADLISLSTDYETVDRALQGAAKGYSLNEYYDSSPSSLQGIVEYIYDLNSRARMRLLEPLTYIKYAIRRHQSLVVHRESEMERKFFLNTPRLPSDGDLHLRAAFASEVVDLLAVARTAPVNRSRLMSLLAPITDRADVIAGMFTTAAPNRDQPEHDGSGVRVRYFGHACVLLQSCSTTVLIDPVIAYGEAGSTKRFTHADLPDRIDYLVITHGHQDHFSPESLLQLRHKVGTVVVPSTNGTSLADPSMKLILRELGFEHVISLDMLDEVSTKDGFIRGLPFLGEHSDLDIAGKQSVLVELAGVRALFLVDAEIRDKETSRLVAENVGRLDLLFFGMECHGAPLTWLYGPLLTAPINRQNDESRRLSASDAERAWDLVRSFDCSKVFIYAMGQEPWLRYMMGLEYTEQSVQMIEINKFLACARENDLSALLLNGQHQEVVV